MKKIFLMIVSGTLLFGLTGCSNFSKTSRDNVVDIYMKNAAKDKPQYEKVNIKIKTEKFNIVAKDESKQEQANALLDDLKDVINSSISGIPGVDLISFEEGKSNETSLTIDDNNPLLGYECSTIPDVKEDVTYYSNGDSFKMSQTVIQSQANIKLSMTQEISYNEFNLLSGFYVNEQLGINETTASQEDKDISDYDYVFTFALNMSLSYSK